MKKVQKGRVSLERALSKLGLASRVESRALIEAGKVKVHGQLEINPLRPVNPESAHIEINGSKALRAATEVLLFHKPNQVVTTKRDPEGRKTIYDFLPLAYHSFHAVGRLDMHTTGLLLLTNDTKLSHFLTDPANAIVRVYQVVVNGELSEATAEKMRGGIDDAGERLHAKKVTILKSSRRQSSLELQLDEGKNREIRRLCLHFQHEVIGLKRTAFGRLELGDLKVGRYRLLTVNELDLIKST